MSGALFEPKPGRAYCCIPYCGKSFKSESPDVSWICRDHWKLVPRDYRRAFNRSYNEMKRRADGKFCIKTYRLWNRCRAAAVEAAAGIG